MSSVIITALQQALLFLPLALGIYISYRILAITDLTVEGTFVLGAAVFARLLTAGMHEVTALLLALLAGGLAGAVVAMIQRFAKIDSLIASILAIFMLYSVNFKAMGRPNISLLNTHSLIIDLQNQQPLLLWFLISLFAIVLIALLALLLHSRLGLLLRAYGDNVQVLSHLGKNSLVLLVFGLVISNLLAALSGVLTAQINGYADINMGLGMALTAIGSMMIGLTVVKNLRHHDAPYRALFELPACFLGVFIYFAIVNGLLVIGVDPIYLKLLLGLVLIFFLSTAKRKGDGYASANA